MIAEIRRLDLHLLQTSSIQKMPSKLGAGSREICALFSVMRQNMFDPPAWAEDKANKDEYCKNNEEGHVTIAVECRLEDWRYASQRLRRL